MGQKVQGDRQEEPKDDQRRVERGWTRKKEAVDEEGRGVRANREQHFDGVLGGPRDSSELSPRDSSGLPKGPLKPAKNSLRTP